MAPALLETGIMFYEIVQVIVALFAIILAVSWKKFEFLAGLSFLALYTIIETIDTYIFTFVQVVYLDIAQFGFILLAILFFIIGMHPSWSAKIVPGTGKQNSRPETPPPEPLISILRRL